MSGYIVRARKPDEPKQVEIPGTQKTHRRPTLFTAEQLRQASRAMRKAARPPGNPHAERDALRLLSRVEKGQTMDTEVVKATLQRHEADYERGKQMLESLDAQRNDVLRGMVRLEGAMTALRLLLGNEAPPIPPAIAAPPVPEGEPPIGTVQ